MQYQQKRVEEPYTKSFLNMNLQLPMSHGSMVHFPARGLSFFYVFFTAAGQCTPCRCQCVSGSLKGLTSTIFEVAAFG